MKYTERYYQDLDSAWQSIPDCEALSGKTVASKVLVFPFSLNIIQVFHAFDFCLVWFFVFMD